MSRARLWQIGLILGAALALEFLCRVGIIDRLTMIPPSQMLVALGVIAVEQSWFWPDVSYTLINIASAVAISLVGGFLIGLIVHALPRLRARSIRYSPPITRCRSSSSIRCSSCSSASARCR